MRRAATRLAALLAVLLGGCGGETTIAPVDVQVRVATDRREIRPGQGFALRVVRTWQKELDPSPWDDALLSPLVLRAPRVERREDARRVEETRHFRAHAFTRSDVTVPAVPFAARPRDGGEVRLAAARPLRLRVLPEVDAEAPGPPELPADLPGRGPPWWAFAAALLALAGAAFALRRRAPAPAPSAPAPTPPDVLALAALEGLGTGAPRADVLALDRVLRAFVAGHWGLPAARRTTQELAGVPGLAALLGPCDRVKFAAHEPSAGERDDLLAAAAAFVREAR